MRGSLRLLSVITASVLVFIAVVLAAAEAPANEHFQRTWERTDQPVQNGSVARTWIWGPEGNTGEMQEAYAEAPGGLRTVQYFDKSRMEINNPDGDPSSPFYVTNGLLVVELMTGQLQVGNTQFEPHAPAAVNVAGDPDDPTSPTYADLAPLRSAPPLADGAVITQRIDGNGTVTDDPSLAGQNVTAAFRLTLPGIDHQVASPFWEFLNSSGPVVVNGQAVSERLFEPWFYATGYPITEAYWADVNVGGTVRLVLMQCFERRCLTYTPGNPEGFLTEAGNVGQHYYTWRYEQIPNENGTPTATATATPTEPGEPSASPTTTTTPTEEPVTDYEYLAGWGGLYSPVTPLERPGSIADDGNNHLWVTDSWHHRLVQYDEHGVLRASIGSPGTGNAQFNFPMDIAFSANGDMYVADQNNNRIQVFNIDGAFTYVNQWGSEGTGNGQFKNASGIAIQNGIVYVIDNGNHRVQMFNLAGVYQGQFGGEGSGNGQFYAPQRLAFDPQGNVYVVDAFNHRVQKFTSSGSYISQFGSFGVGDGQLKYPVGIDIDDTGVIYVADHQNHRIQKFSPEGIYLAKWGSNGPGVGQFENPAGLEIDADGNLYVADSNNHRIQKFTAEGTFLFQITDNRRGHVNIPTDISLDQNGNLLVSDSALELQTISRYTPDGIPLDDYSLKMNGAGPYDRPDAAAVNETGDIYVVDSYANRVQRFSSAWVYKGQWGTPGTGPGQFSGPQDIAIDADGNVYVADSLNNRVQKFDANGVFLDQWGGVGDGDGQFNNATSIAIDGERIYVTDLGNSRVQVFDREGTYLGQWGSAGADAGQLAQPIGIAVNPDGYVLVVEYANNRVQVFTPSGESVGTFGSLGTGEGQFTGPLAVIVDADGYAYVTEVGNHRIQKFAPVP